MNLEGLQLGNYQLLGPIGSGGMGEVYLAQDVRVNRQVAIKMMRTDLMNLNVEENEVMQRLFQREMDIVSRLDHPHILTLYDFGEEAINHTIFTYMVMPYRPDGSLNTWFQQQETNDKPTLEDIAALIKQAADALQYAHDLGIIHQDIKPSNFLIRKRKDHPRRPDLFLTDFGIAKLTNGSTSSQLVRGTPYYMAPEQWAGEPVAASDQYALAVMAYSFLTGHLPFSGNSMQAMFQHINKQPIPPSQHNPQLSSSVDKVILKSLEKQPEQRFKTIIDFSHDLERAISRNTQPTSPIPLAYQSSEVMSTRQLDNSYQLDIEQPDQIKIDDRESQDNFVKTPSSYLMVNLEGELVPEPVEAIYQYEQIQALQRPIVKESLEDRAQEAPASVAETLHDDNIEQLLDDYSYEQSNLLESYNAEQDLPISYPDQNILTDESVREEPISIDPPALEEVAEIYQKEQPPEHQAAFLSDTMNHLSENRSIYILIITILIVAIILAVSIYLIRENIATGQSGHIFRPQIIALLQNGHQPLSILR